MLSRCFQFQVAPTIWFAFSFEAPLDLKRFLDSFSAILFGLVQCIAGVLWRHKRSGQSSWSSHSVRHLSLRYMQRLSESLNMFL